MVVLRLNPRPDLGNTSVGKTNISCKPDEMDSAKTGWLMVVGCELWVIGNLKPKTTNPSLLQLIIIYTKR